MSITAATLQVKVGANTSDAERQLAGFGQKINGFAASAARAGSAMFTGLAMGAGIAAFNGLASAAGNAVASIGDSVTAASNLAETINMMTVVMGDWGDDVVHWSENSARALGMTQNQALTAAGTFAAFGKAANMSGEQTTKFSTNLVGLAADLGSFYNTSPEDAILAIGAALRGEMEPIRRYNVLLDDMTLRQEAVKLKIAETTTQALTPQQKVLATNSLLWQKTGDAQGDFARTSGGLAGQQKILTANMDALSVTLGNALLPAMTAWTQMSNTLVTAVLPSMGDLIGTYLVPAMTDLATYLSDGAVALGAFMDAVDAGADPVGAFIDAFDLEPWAVEMNKAIGAFEQMANAWATSLEAMKIPAETWAIHWIVQVNRVIDAINIARASAGGNLIDRLEVPRSSAAGTIPVNSNPIRLDRIPMSGWGGLSGTSGIDIKGMGAAADLSGKALAAAGASANKTAAALDRTIGPVVSLGNAATGAGSAVKSAADELASALRGVPGLFGTSSVTAGDMAKAAAGLPVNFADDYVRRVGDELLNGVNLADIDPAEVAASLGMDPSVPAKLIYDELVRQWGSGEYFADPANIAKINWTAVQAKIDQDARATLGQSNILAGAIAAGITLESMAPVAAATVTGMTGALESSNLGAATGATAIAAMATPDAITRFEESGADAAGSWMNGWHTAVNGWIPPMPATPTTTTPLVENPTGPPAVPINIIPYRPPGYETPGPPGRSGSTSSGGHVFNITINGAGAGKPADYERAGKNGVLDALRARGRV